MLDRAEGRAPRGFYGKAIIGALNGKTGELYRLPTEAEWEFTARSRGKAE